jgi:hypothetical protein
MRDPRASSILVKPAGQPTCNTTAPDRGAGDTKGFAMNTARAVILALLIASPAAAQQSGAAPAAPAAALGGQSFAVSPRIQDPTPLFFFGDLAAGIWTRVPPPYDATANRVAAANPLP